MISGTEWKAPSSFSSVSELTATLVYPAKHVVQFLPVPANGQLETTAAFNYGQNGGPLQCGLLAAHIDPFLSSQRDAPHGQPNKGHDRSAEFFHRALVQFHSDA